MTGKSSSSRPFEVDARYLEDHIDEMVSSVFAELESQFLVMPRGDNFVEYQDFQDAYEVLKRHTAAFSVLTDFTVWEALKEDALVLVVLRTILGLSPPEWADLARSERESDIDQNYARRLDVDCRGERGLFNRLIRPRDDLRLDRTEALVSVAVEAISRGAPAGASDTVHRLAKFDTDSGLTSVQHAASQHVPYAVLLYERYLGRPFASHRDSVSGLVGDVMESAVEERLAEAKISFRKTRRAEKIAGFDQAPDIIVPDELNPAVVIEAKLTSDDGTARDKATRIVHLAELRDKRIREGKRGFEVVACIDGRGFGIRRQDMRRILLSTEGKVFTLSTLDWLIS
ncbi:MAG: hypothetical protein ACRDJC_05685 [Thermomicrobiales bacterium]